MEQIEAWKPKCCNKVFLYKGNARRHERNCPHNPDNKACATCGHNYAESETKYIPPYPGNNPGDNDVEIGYYWCNYHEKEISKYFFDENALQPQKNCEHWIPKEVSEE